MSPPLGTMSVSRPELQLEHNGIWNPHALTSGFSPLVGPKTARTPMTPTTYNLLYGFDLPCLSATLPAMPDVPDVQSFQTQAVTKTDLNEMSPSYTYGHLELDADHCQYTPPASEVYEPNYPQCPELKYESREYEIAPSDEELQKLVRNEDPKTIDVLSNPFYLRAFHSIKRRNSVYKCTLRKCRRSFPSFFSLMRHQTRAHKSSGERYCTRKYCAFSKVAFANNTEALRHFQAMHAKDEGFVTTSYYCTFCNAGFTRCDSLVRHNNRSSCGKTQKRQLVT